MVNLKAFIVELFYGFRFGRPGLLLGALGSGNGLVLGRPRRLGSPDNESISAARPVRGPVVKSGIPNRSWNKPTNIIAALVSSIGMIFIWSMRPLEKAGINSCKFSDPGSITLIHKGVLLTVYTATIPGGSSGIIDPSVFGKDSSFRGLDGFRSFITA